uniref:Nuclear receptor domain-containing protein n=1 Tax=Rhabditophanes sp. KR3021 TaxID=114890 RepID=A0AC35TV79_9BILA
MNDNLFNSEKANLESKKGPSSCSICGIMNKSIYYHYNSESCSGCKTFFRRSIVLSKVYACKWGNNCEITKNSKCRACRFYKCLRMGMNPTSKLRNRYFL